MSINTRNLPGKFYLDLYYVLLHIITASTICYHKTAITNIKMCEMAQENVIFGQKW